MTYIIPNTFVDGTVITAAAFNENFVYIATALDEQLPRDGSSPMLGPLLLAVGTTAAPGLAFSGDTNTGINRAVSDTLTLVAGGTVAATATALGLSFSASADIPMVSHKLTGLAAGSGNGDSVRYEQVVGVFLPLAGGTMSGNIVMGSNKLTGLSAGSGAGDSVRYEQVLLLTGGTMSGAIAMGANKITGLAAGTIAGDAVRFEQLGTLASQNANAVAITGGTITGLGTPLPIASGGTAGATITAAQTALSLLPGVDIMALSTAATNPPVGTWMLLEYTNATPLADGATATGNDLRYLVGTSFWSLGDGRRPNNGTTWINRSGQPLASGGTYRTGQFVRFA